jgi:F-box protein 11
VIEPGLYRESVRIDKPLELVGDGSGEPVELWPAEGSCLEVEAHQTVIRGLKLHGRSRTPVISSEYRAAVVEDCVITGGSPVVALRGNDIVLKRCLIAEGKTGLHLGLTPNLEIDDCAIARNDGPGIVVAEGMPVVNNCRIYDNRGPGVAVLPDADSTFRECDIYGNAGAGIKAEGGATVEQCHIHHNGDKDAAVHVIGVNFSRIIRCEIDGFGRAGVSVEGAMIGIEECAIHDGLGVGISLHGETDPTMIRDCDIHHVARTGVEIGSSASPNIWFSKIHDNGGAGIVVLPGGGGLLRFIHIYDNAVPGVDIRPGGDLSIEDCRIDQRDEDEDR